MVNYSPALESVISDIEVDMEEVTEKMYYITYFISGTDKELVIATTRPETMLADQAVAVNPKDKRYKKFIGKNVILPILNKEIPIIGDEMVDMEFGTGVVKITPAHDPADFETAKRHGLRMDYTVIDKSGHMNTEAGMFAGFHAATQARENIVELLRSKGNLEKVEPYTHKVGFCSRGKCRVESVVSTQWFVRASELAKRVITGYEKGEFQILPARFNKTFEDWIYNLRDWAISRQLWWGHQIPAYYHTETDELIGVGKNAQEVLEKYNTQHGTSLTEADIRRDDDVLDTWFSSGLWPLLILDWDLNPENIGELFKKYYPAQVLETGHDILFFWVIRMLLLSYHYTDKTPFETIYLHGLIFDESGKKMSKSFGNAIDPLDVIAEYSTDAMRLALTLGNTPGNNVNFSMKTVEEYSLFLNKFWNIMRFAAMNVGTITASREELYAKISANENSLLPYEKWILSRLSFIIDRATSAMESYAFSSVGPEILAFIRDDFADFAIEAYKIEKDNSPLGKEVISVVALEILALMHPYIPHITETLYGYITEGKMLATAPWPYTDRTQDVIAEQNIEKISNIVRVIRNIRAEKNIKPGELKDVWIVSSSIHEQVIRENENLLSGLAKIDTLTIGEKPENMSSVAYGIVLDIEIFVDAEIDTEALAAEKERLLVQIEDKKNYLRGIQTKLANPSFAKNAPEKIVRAEMEKRHQAEEQLEKFQEKLAQIEARMQ